MWRTPQRLPPTVATSPHSDTLSRSRLLVCKTIMQISRHDNLEVHNTENGQQEEKKLHVELSIHPSAMSPFVYTCQPSRCLSHCMLSLFYVDLSHGSHWRWYPFLLPPHFEYSCIISMHMNERRFFPLFYPPRDPIVPDFYSKLAAEWKKCRSVVTNRFFSIFPVWELKLYLILHNRYPNYFRKSNILIFSRNDVWKILNKLQSKIVLCHAFFTSYCQ